MVDELDDEPGGVRVAEFAAMLRGMTDFELAEYRYLLYDLHGPGNSLATWAEAALPRVRREELTRDLRRRLAPVAYELGVDRDELMDTMLTIARARKWLDLPSDIEELVLSAAEVVAKRQESEKL